MVKLESGVLLQSLSIDRNSTVPVGAQVALKIRAMIVSGDLTSGERLPSSRVLATDLGVSRSTITAVFDQLIAEGMISSWTGSGSFVSTELAFQQADIVLEEQKISSAHIEPHLAKLNLLESSDYVPRLPKFKLGGAFATGMPAMDAFPMAIWSKISAKCWREDREKMLSYPPVYGIGELREAITFHLRANRGIACLPDEVIVFNGAQHAFNRIGSILLNPGDPVWFENPGTIGARNALLALGAKLVPVPIDDQGMNVEAGLAKSPSPKLIFTTPAHQHPLGITMSLKRRFELLNVANLANAWIIEDDYVGEFHYRAPSPQTLKSVDKQGRVIYVGTFSKSLFPALRLGYVVAPPKLAEIFRKFASATLQGTPSHTQMVVARFIGGGHFSTHLRRMRKLYSERHQALIDGATLHLPDLVKVHPSTTGLHTTASLAPGLDENDISRMAESAGLQVTPISRFCIEPVKQSGLVLGFSTTTPKEIVAGLKKLSKVVKKSSSASGSPYV
jgi:GntR family transcriptional regulator/MocR family aminotransferase